METWLDEQPSEFFFLSGLQKLEQRAKRCTELRGEYVEQIPSMVIVACFLPGWAMDLSAPSRTMHMKHAEQKSIIRSKYVLCEAIYNYTFSN